MEPIAYVVYLVYCLGFGGKDGLKWTRRTRVCNNNSTRWNGTGDDEGRDIVDQGGL